MKSLDEALEEGVWAITIGPNSKYIGQLWGIDHKAHSNRDYFISQLTLPIIVRYAQEFCVDDVEMSHLAPYLREVQVKLIGRCTDVKHSVVYTTPLDLIFFDDMLKLERIYYKNLIREGIRKAEENFAYLTSVFGRAD